MKAALKKIVKRAVKKAFGPLFDNKVAVADPLDTFEEFVNANGKLTILDCGAHVGHCSLSAQKRFPNATIHAFEASPYTFEQLTKNIAGNDNIKAHNTAVGEITGKGVVEMTIVAGKDGMATDNHIETPGRESLHLKGGEKKKIDCVRISDFCKENGINNVDYLKIDVEGHEIQALKGAQDLLEQKKIKFVELELGMAVKNKYHTPFREAHEFMTGLGYDVVGFYNQTRDFVNKEPFIRRIDVLFMAQT